MDKDTLRKAQGLIGEARLLVDTILGDQQEKLDEAEETENTDALEERIASLEEAIGKLEDADTDIETAIGGSVG